MKLFGRHAVDVGSLLMLILFPVPLSASQLQIFLKDGTYLTGEIQHELKAQILQRTEMVEKAVKFVIKPGEIKAVRGSDVLLKNGHRFSVRVLDSVIQVKTKGEVIAVRAGDIARIDLKTVERLDDYDKKAIEEIGATSFQFMVLIIGILSLSAAYLAVRYKEMRWRWSLIFLFASWALFLISIYYGREVHGAMIFLLEGNKFTSSFFAMRGPAASQLKTFYIGLSTLILFLVLDSVVSPIFEKHVGRRIRFTYYDVSAISVHIGGDFNSWEVTSMPAELRKKAYGRWERSLFITPGQYAYKFLVDYTDWREWKVDPVQERKGLNPYGTFNSVLTVS